jgi:hypothetical protein
MRSIKLEGIAEIGGVEFVMVCEKCGHHEREGGSVEFNFKHKKVYFTCRCGYANEMSWAGPGLQPYPRSRIG